LRGTQAGVPQPRSFTHTTHRFVPEDNIFKVTGLLKKYIRRIVVALAAMPLTHARSVRRIQARQRPIPYRFPQKCGQARTPQI
jgi:hypothetical protein